MATRAIESDAFRDLYLLFAFPGKEALNAIELEWPVPHAWRIRESKFG